MRPEYQLEGYTAHYVSGHRRLSKTLKALRDVVVTIEVAEHVVESANINYDGEFGWTATVLYL